MWDAWGRTSETCLGPTCGSGAGGVMPPPRSMGNHCLMLSWVQPCPVPLPRGEAWASTAALLGCLLGLGKGPGKWGPHLRRSSPATGDCGSPPRMTHSRPSSNEHASSFPVGSRVTYACIEGAIKIPGRSDTVECLPGARWSKLPEPCGRKYLLSLKHSSLACLWLGLKFLPLTAAALQWHHLTRQGTNPFPVAAVRQSC